MTEHLKISLNTDSIPSIPLVSNALLCKYKIQNTAMMYFDRSLKPLKKSNKNNYFLNVHSITPSLKLVSLLFPLYLTRKLKRKLKNLNKQIIILGYSDFIL